MIQHELSLELLLRIALAFLQTDDLFLKRLRVCHPVKARDGGDDDDIFTPRE